MPAFAFAFTTRISFGDVDQVGRVALAVFAKPFTVATYRPFLIALSFVSACVASRSI